MTTALELSANVGRVGLIGSDSQVIRADKNSPRFEVRIEQFKTAYGCPRYLITPVSGTGSQWVNADRVQILEEKGNGQ